MKLQLVVLVTSSLAVALNACVASGHAVKARVDDEAAAHPAVELPGMAFSGVPTGWEQPRLSSVSRRDGRVITREYTSWPTPDLEDEHETVGICVTATEDAECAAPPAEVISRIELEAGVTAVVHVLPRTPAVDNAGDRRQWSAFTANVATKGRS